MKAGTPDDAQGSVPRACPPRGVSVSAGVAESDLWLFLRINFLSIHKSYIMKFSVLKCTILYFHRGV